jgi:hypothetical protein
MKHAEAKHDSSDGNKSEEGEEEEEDAVPECQWHAG